MSLDRRTFIGGCVAAGVGSALPIAKAATCDCGDQTITIPAEALIYWSTKSECAIAVAMMGGREVHVECDVEVRDGRHWVKNTGRIVG